MLSILRTLPMMRTTFFALLLAALIAGPVYAASVQTTRTHRSTAAARASHTKAHHPSASRARHSTRHLAGRRTTRHATAQHAVIRRQTQIIRPSTAHRRLQPRPAPKTQSPEQTPDTDPPTPPPAPEPVSLHTLHRTTRIAPVPPLHGTLESLVRQNEKNEAEGLERILDDNDLADRIARKMLVPVPVSAALSINDNLPHDRRYCRPWTAAFLSDLARAHQAQFHHPLEVSSAVRTVEYQKRLMETNGNATEAEGDIVSPHVTGATIDIAKSGLGQQELYWMRARLLALQNAGKIDVEEEFQQACFHITVYKDYVPAEHRSLPRSRSKRARDATDAPSANALASSGL